MLRMPLEMMLVGCLCLLTAAPQDTGKGATEDIRPPSAEVQLAQHGIGSDIRSLLGALKNSDPEVRILAAAELGKYRHDPAVGSDAVPALAAALQVESEPRAAAVIATILGQFGDARGVTALETMCFDRSTDPRVKVQVEIDLLALNSQSCVDPILDLASGGDDRDPWAALDGMIELLPSLQRFPDLTPAQNERIVEIVRKGLSSPKSYVRINAASVRSRMIDAAAASDLQNALALEPDPQVRGSMRMVLDDMRRRANDRAKK